MGNYAVGGAVLAAALRAAIRSARGDWLEGDPGWYAWAKDHRHRFGLERPAGDACPMSWAPEPSDALAPRSPGMRATVRLSASTRVAVAAGAG